MRKFFVLFMAVFAMFQVSAFAEQTSKITDQIRNLEEGQSLTFDNTGRVYEASELLLPNFSGGIGDDSKKEKIVTNKNIPHVLSNNVNDLNVANTQASLQFRSSLGSGGYTITNPMTATQVADSYCLPTPTSSNTFIEDGVLMYTTDYYMDVIPTLYNGTFVNHLWYSFNGISYEAPQESVNSFGFTTFAENSDPNYRFQGQLIYYLRFHSHEPTNIAWMVYTADENNTALQNGSYEAELLGCFKLSAPQRTMNNGYYWLSYYAGVKLKDVALETSTTYGVAGTYNQMMIGKHSPYKYPSLWYNWLGF